MKLKNSSEGNRRFEDITIKVKQTKQNNFSSSNTKCGTDKKRNWERNEIWILMTETLHGG